MQAVIFDMDGVIIDSEPIHNRLILKTLAHYGVTFDPKDFDLYVGMSNPDFFRKMKELHRMSASDEEMTVYQTDQLYETIDTEELEPVPGIREMLAELKRRGIPAAIASSSSMGLIERITRKFAIQDAFSAFTSGEDLHRSKPDPTIYLVTAEKLGVDPKNCLVIEDASHGVAAAKAAGMTCIGYQNPGSGNQDLTAADQIVQTITEIDLNRFMKNA